MKKFIIIMSLLLLIIACKQGEVTRTWLVTAKHIVPRTWCAPGQYNIYLQDINTGTRRRLWHQIIYFAIEIGDEITIHQKGEVRLISKNFSYIKWWRIVSQIKILKER